MSLSTHDYDNDQLAAGSPAQLDQGQKTVKEMKKLRDQKTGFEKEAMEAVIEYVKNEVL